MASTLDHDALSRAGATVGGPATSGVGAITELVAFALLVVASLLITGYQPYIDNNAFQISLVQRYVDRTAYPGDPFMATAPYYASLLWHGIALLSRLVPTMAQLGFLFLVERCLMLWSFRALALAMAPESRLAPLGAMALAALAPHPLIAEGTIVPIYMEQTGLAVAFLALAFAAFLRRRPLACAVWLGLGFDLNSMYGAYAITYLAAMTLADRGAFAQWRRWLAAAALFFAVAAPAIVLSAQALSRGEPDRDLWLWASRVRFPHHLYPLTWTKRSLAHFGLVFALISAVAWKRRHWIHGAAPALACSAVAAGWLAIAFLAPTLGNPVLLTTHPGRATDLWQVFGGVFLVCVAARVLDEHAIDPLLGGIALLGAIAVWFAPPVPLVLVGLVAVALVLVRAPIAFERRLSLAILAVVVISAAAIAGLRVVKERSPSGLLGWRPDPDVVAVGRWAARHTPREAVLLSDPFRPELRPLAGRPLFTTWKDGAAILWDRGFVGEWTARMQAFGLEPRAPGTEQQAPAIVRDGFNRLTDDRVRALRDRFRVDYWVVGRDHASAFPEVFATERLRVLDVSGAAR